MVGFVNKVYYSITRFDFACSLLMWWYCINFLVLYVYRACRLKKKAQHEANKVKLQGLEMEQRKFFFYVDSSFMGLLWISSEKDGQRIIFGGGWIFQFGNFWVGKFGKALVFLIGGLI